MVEKTINENDVKTLLNEVGFIQKTDLKIRKATGKRYNLFNIMRVQRSELKHSLIIGDLLNPKGKHDQGDLFLKLFLDVLKNKFKNGDGNESGYKSKNLEILKDFQLKNAKIKIEELIRENKIVEGGRIDILLESDNKFIVIENKIDAEDQYRQLIRYKNYVGDKGVVFYLNKYGDAPTTKSIKVSPKKIEDAKKQSPGMLYELELDKDFYIISFKNDIRIWIEKCIEVSIDKPYIRENLNQYLEVIKRITKQINSNYMNKELTTFFSKHISLIDQAKIVSNYMNSGKIFEELVGKNICEKAEEISKELKATLIYDRGNWVSYNGGNNKVLRFDFKDLQYFTISFKINAKSGYNGLVFSLRKKGGKDKDLSNLNSDILEMIKSSFSIDKLNSDRLKPYEYDFIFHKDLEKEMKCFKNLEDEKSIKAILDGSFKTKFKEEIERLHKIVLEIENKIKENK